VRKEDREKLMPSAAQWYNYMSRAYVQSYLEHARNSEFIPSSPDDLALLLDIFLLEKAIYELNYELNSRPDWVLIPLQGIRSIMEKYTDNPE
jgi:maltose alpha-D-glucosyltransferase/alpha-amylase